jgi:hypothetical protein
VEVTVRSSNLWSIMQCSVVEVYLYFGGRYHFHLKSKMFKQTKKKESTLFGFLFNLNMEADGSFKVPVNFCQTIQYHIPEDRTIHILFFVYLSFHNQEQMHMSIVSFL